jgi:hypothetical protein
MKIEEARSETAKSSAFQNMERDAPWTAWIRMIQPHDEAATHSRGPLGTKVPACPAFLGDLGSLAMNKKSSKQGAHARQSHNAVDGRFLETQGPVGEMESVNRLHELENF